MRTAWLHLGFLTSAAVLAGWQAQGVVGIKLGAWAQDSSSGPVQTLRPPQAEVRDFHYATEHNIFGAPGVRPGPEEFADLAPIEEAPEEVPDLEELPETELNLKLVGTSVFEIQDQSLASIVDTKERGPSRVYAARPCGPAPCETLPYEARLIDVGVEDVILFNEAEKRYERLRLEEEEPRGKRRPKAKRGKEDDKKEKKPPRKGPAGADLPFTKVSENHYRIPASTKIEAMGMLSRLGSQVRMVPTDEGYKLGWVRRGSIIEKLGVKKGDIIKAVNGYDVSTMEGAMTAFQKLQNGDRFSLDLIRGGSKQTIEYEIE